MADLDCRVAKLEAILELNTKECSTFQAEISQSLKELNATVHDIQIQREKQLSFFGGVSAVVGGVAAIAAFFINKYF